MRGLDAAWAGAIGTWVGALGQILVASAVGIIAYQTFVSLRRQAKSNAFYAQKILVNDFNKMVIESIEVQNYLIQLRPSIIGPMEDAVIFTYLNYLDATVRANAEKVVDDIECTETLTNGVHFFSKLTREQLQRFLSRGYSHDFVSKVLARFNDISKN